MVAKKPTGVKSVTLGDVRTAEAATGIKASPSAQSGFVSTDPPKDIKDLDDDVKDFDQQQKEEAKQAKQLDKDVKKADRKMNR